MPKRKPMSEEAIKAAAQKFAEGTASRAALEQVGISQRAYPEIKRTAREELEVFRREFSGTLERTALKMAKRLEDESDRLSTGQLPVALGILADKHKSLNEAGAQHTTQNLHLHLTLKDKDEIMARVFGNAHGRKEPL